MCVSCFLTHAYFIGDNCGGRHEPSLDNYYPNNPSMCLHLSATYNLKSITREVRESLRISVLDATLFSLIRYVRKPQL